MAEHKNNFKSYLLNSTSEISKNIGSYETQKKIKEGSYSTIFLAKSKHTGEEVIIKVIDKEKILKDTEDLLLISREIEVLKLLIHRNILTLYEIYESPKYIFLITEYINGIGMIEKMVKKKRFKEEQVLLIFFQLIDAMIYLHKMNICHRNIRAEHILFDKSNRPKIIGFGFSYIIHAQK